MSFYEQLGSARAEDLERASDIIESRLRELAGSDEEDLYGSMPFGLSILGIWATGKTVELVKELAGEEAVNPEGAQLAYTAVQYTLGMLAEVAKWLDVEASLIDGKLPPQRWLATLDATELTELFDASLEQSAATQVDGPAKTLREDLKESYPGLSETIYRLVITLDEEGVSEEFGAGALAGATLLLQALRLKAEKDLLSLDTPQPDESDEENNN